MTYQTSFAADAPKSGFYKVRRHKRGAFLPCRIWWEQARDPETGEPMDRAAHLKCRIDGDELPRKELKRLFPYMRPVSPKEFADLTKAAPLDVPLGDQVPLF